MGPDSWELKPEEAVMLLLRRKQGSLMGGMQLASEGACYSRDRWELADGDAWGLPPTFLSYPAPSRAASHAEGCRTIWP